MIHWLGRAVRPVVRARLNARPIRFRSASIGLSTALSANVPLGATTAAARIVIIPTDTASRVSARQGNWHLTIARGKFSGELASQLEARDGRAIYRSGGVGFQFYCVKTLTGATYLVDGGDAHSTRNDLPQLIRTSALIDQGWMPDPSNSMVCVHYDRIAQARAIAIEPNRSGGARLFRLNGLAALHDLAVSRECAPEGSSVAR